jgi:hypothetical protein
VLDVVWFVRVVREGGRSYELALSLEALETLGVVSTPKVPLRLP